MKICILCEDANVVEARERSAGVLPKHERTPSPTIFGKSEEVDLVSKHLSIPLSETGELPATHWFCFVNVSDATYQKMLESQKHTIIEEARPSEFLAKHNLKRIGDNYAEQKI